MDISEAKSRKERLECDIRELVRKFSSDTHLSVDGISLVCDAIGYEGGIMDYSYNVHCDVRL